MVAVVCRDRRSLTTAACFFQPWTKKSGDKRVDEMLRALDAERAARQSSPDLVLWQQNSMIANDRRYIRPGILCDHGKGSPQRLTAATPATTATLVKATTPAMATRPRADS
jgi:hypothetical protein